MLAALTPPAKPNEASKEAATPTLDYRKLPSGMLDIMHGSQAKYLEGSRLIRSGESAKAREAFNQAVDMLLQSNWDLVSTPALHRFFQDLIECIQGEESLYLQPLSEEEEEFESAAVDDLEKVDLIPITIDPSLQDAAIADLAETRYDIPITLNEMVLKSLKYWLKSGNKHFIDGLRRSGRYRPMIERIFREESIPLDLMYLAQVESFFKTNALSRAQAKGIWQFSRGTAKRYGLKINSYLDERSDPEKSTRAAARYLKDLYNIFHDWHLVLAAYNWGEARVQRLIESSGINDFWRLAALKRRIPKETRNHVPLIIASVILARNPEKYGLPTELDPPLQNAKISLSKRIDLTAAAKLLGITLEQLKKLNPALRGIATPPDYSNYELNVPADSNPKARLKVAALPAIKIDPIPENATRHQILPGDTFGDIAAQYHVSLAELMNVNSHLSPRALPVGKYLYIPPRKASSQKQTQTAAGKSTTLTAAEPSFTSDYTQRHQIQAGDTFAKIAAKYQVPLAELMRINSHLSPKALPVGKWIQIPPRDDSSQRSLKITSNQSTTMGITKASSRDLTSTQLNPTAL